MKYVLSMSCLASLTICVYPWMFNGRPFGGKIGSPKVPEGIRLPDEQFYEFQKVNHFDGSDFRYWKQRYFVSNVTYNPGGPIFLMFGGESEASPAWLVNGAWQQYAHDHGACLVLLEHRYYGKSQPVLDINKPNLQYLSSRQAFEDIVQFIYYFKICMSIGICRIAVLYCLADLMQIVSYLRHTEFVSILFSFFIHTLTGSLAAWTRSRYPYLIQGAVASSAPVVSLMDLHDYFAKVSEALDGTDTKCRMAVQNATSRLYDWWGQPAKYSKLQKMFRLCDKINHDNALHLSVLFYNLAENFAGVVQYNNVNREFLSSKETNITIQTVCSIMIDETRGDSIQRYADVNSLILDTYSEQCINIRYSKLANFLNQTSWTNTSAEGSRQWLYQSCSELGWMQSSYTAKQTFGPCFTTDLCDSVFNPPSHWIWSDIMNNCDETNRFYGGLKMFAPNTIFVNGMLDPWRGVGILSQPSGAASDVEIFNINGTAHCADMFPASPNDPQQLTETRVKISNCIGKWLKT